MKNQKGALDLAASLVHLQYQLEEGPFVLITFDQILQKLDLNFPELFLTVQHGLICLW
jgi:hypothetical protein